MYSISLYVALTGIFWYGCALAYGLPSKSDTRHTLPTAAASRYFKSDLQVLKKLSANGATMNRHPADSLYRSLAYLLSVDHWIWTGSLKNHGALFLTIRGLSDRYRASPSLKSPFNLSVLEKCVSDPAK